MLERTRNSQPAGLDDFCAPSKVQPISIRREGVGECKCAINQQGFISRPLGCSGNCPKEEKRKEQCTGESVLEYTKNMSV